MLIRKNCGAVYCIIHVTETGYLFLVECLSFDTKKLTFAVPKLAVTVI